MHSKIMFLLDMFTCLKCLNDLNFGPGTSSDFEASHSRPSLPSVWSNCDSDLPPSAPSQQLISSSCSLEDKQWHEDKNLKT